MQHPFNRHQFIVCLPDGHISVMDCPENLVFNRYLDRCDYNDDPITGCSSQPCLYGSTCVDMPDDFDYRCVCLPGFSGTHCEQAPDVCSLQPCGTAGRCHAMSAGSPIPYYCSCFDDQAFGLGCEPRRLERNPCSLSPSHESYYLTRLGQALFVQCDDRKMHLKFCSRPLVFSFQAQACVYVNEIENGTTNNDYTTTTTTTPETTTTTTATTPVMANYYSHHYYYPVNPQYPQYYNRYG